MKINTQRLRQIVTRFKKKNILVVGDLILDHYIFGKVDRISPEAPVPVVWANQENFVCGGSANVGLNLVSLGAKAALAGVIGKDHFGKVLFSLIQKGRIATDLVTVECTRPTTLKTRILAQHQQMLRLDWESVQALSPSTNALLLKRIKKYLHGFDAIIIEDYGKGVINPHLVGAVVEACKKNNKVVTVDPKEEHFDYYKHVTSLTPNLKEAQNAANIKIKSKGEIPALGKMIMDKLQPKSLLITLGEDGMILFADNHHYHIPTMALEVYDVTGAGDTVIAVFTLALACGATHYEAALIANFAAGIVVEKLGAATTTAEELLRRINA
ncbi:MAG: D-glycero-beta-D-manno-heptose-7-phosphate kinase [Candidatus Omnitrophota bacterium]